MTHFLERLAVYDDLPARVTQATALVLRFLNVTFAFILKPREKKKLSSHLSPVYTICAEEKNQLTMLQN